MCAWRLTVFRQSRLHHELGIGVLDHGGGFTGGGGGGGVATGLGVFRALDGRSVHFASRRGGVGGYARVGELAGRRS